MEEKQALFWSDFLKRDVSFLSRGKKETSLFFQLAATCKEYVEPIRGGKVLEIGCGDGMDAIALALDYGCNVVAIDISSKRAEIAQANIQRYGLTDRINSRVGNAHSLDFPPEEFDAVLGNSIMLFLEHDRVCEEVSRVLKPGGRFILSNESLALSPLVQMSRKFGVGLKSKDLESHIRKRLSPDTIEGLGGKYFTRYAFTLHFGILLQLLWGVRLLAERLKGLVMTVDSYNRPDVYCPNMLKNLDMYLIQRWGSYRRRTWIATACFVK